MAKGVKIDNKKIAEIVTSYALTGSYNATAKEVGVCCNSVRNIISKQKEENNEEYEKVCKEKKEEFYDKAKRIIDKGLTILDKRFDKALKHEEDIDKLINMIMNIKETEEDGITYKDKLDMVKKLNKMQLNNLSEITTAIGTLYDKNRLEKGESTQNNSIEIKMSEELKELSK